MGVLQEFLENSTIHGLSYIAGTTKYIRIIWIFIVITGFCMGGGHHAFTLILYFKIL